MIKNNKVKQKFFLPRNIRYGLMSLKTENLIKEFSLQQQFDSEEKTKSLSDLIREMLSRALSEEILRKEVFRRFRLNNAGIDSFLKELKEIIKKIKKIGIEAVKKDLVVLKFKELLEKIPEVAEQEIGVHPIFFPGEERRYSPFIENWVTDYKLRKNDQQKNVSLNVSDYLYNSENAQQLSKPEKEQLSIILSASEKNSSIYYNRLFEEIDFEIIKLLKKSKKPEASFNITKFESKPWHDVDEKVRTEPRLVAKTVAPEVKTPNISSGQTNVLDLNNYIKK